MNAPSREPQSSTGRHVEEVRVRVLPDGRMSRRDAARYIGVSTKTMAMWKLEGKGPPSILIGMRRFYWRDKIDFWIQEQAEQG